MSAIEHAQTILGWFENLTAEEIPPEWMWSLNDELVTHFEWVKEQRGSGRSRDDDDDDGTFMMQNEYARGRGRNA